MDKYLKPSDNTGEMVTTCKVVFQPSGAAGMVECGTSLLDAARQLGVGIESICGGAGTCGKCQIVIEEGQFPKHNLVSNPLHASPASESELALCSKQGLAAGVRLSCMALVEGDLLVTVPEEARANKQIVVKAATDRIMSGFLRCWPNASICPRSNSTFRPCAPFLVPSARTVVKSP